ncbi:urea transport system substrate-binding protein [Aequitasia blattaphilus]|uniref:Urea ABC transporter substrate-binding protein n=1 Tax=Aequitasia blattaphilus TaxID=2949332 RepID=A0ABT1E9G5_9FIRM|nr:urea ABC transporter substrate-binding protein [Aequitasia blattaphilus]MCP1102249.1 urea ABC transporter substrate-binding protein [Aequitasia blattaphilus]MCR8614889.1 urea ABC transporter substrate-binding protein [Aequitasia blattaphilus]
MKKKRIMALLMSIVMTGALVGCSGAQAKDADSDEASSVKVGILYSATGSMAISEGAVKDAEVLAIEEINAEGGILGKQIEYVAEDGASEPSTFATKAEKLIDQDKVSAVFGCWTSASRKAVKPVFEEYENLLLYPVQYEGMEESSNIVYTGAAPNQQIVPAIDYLIEQGYKKFFLLGSDYVFPRTANMIINSQCEAKDVEVVGEEYAQMDQTDFGSIIAKIEAAKPDVIINTLNGTGNLSFFKQMNEKNYTSEDYMTMSFSIAEEEVKTIGADILKDHMVSWNYYMTTDTPENEKFVEAYKKEYGTDRVTSDPAEAAYDAVYLWKAAVEKAESFEPADVIAAIEDGGISFLAPEGIVEIDGTNHHLIKPVRIGVIAEDGKINIVKETEPVKPDPYLESYDWAVDSNLKPLE